jgi:hypothetical protein
MSLFQEIRGEIKAVVKEPTSRDLTMLALLFFGFPAVIGGLKLWKGDASAWYWIGAGVFLAALRIIPPLFRVIYRSWLAFAVILGHFVSRILLTVVFFLVLLPTGLIMRVLGKDPMERRMDPHATTYWQKRDTPPEYTVERYERQF